MSAPCSWASQHLSVVHELLLSRTVVIKQLVEQTGCMSTNIGSFDAKIHLSEYLERASRGESFTITRRGVPLAVLRPHEGGEDGLATALADCSEFRARLSAPRPDFNIVEAVREDRSR